LLLAHKAAILRMLLVLAVGVLQHQHHPQETLELVLAEVVLVLLVELVLAQGVMVALAHRVLLS
jgi:hypothetical protein